MVLLGELSWALEVFLMGYIMLEAGGGTRGTDDAGKVAPGRGLGSPLH